MDNRIDNKNAITHEVKMYDRKKIVLSGIKKIVSFDPEEFLIDSSMGMIHIKGSGLDIVSLDTINGYVELKGKIDSYQYLDGNKKRGENSFISRLFQ